MSILFDKELIFHYNKFMELRQNNKNFNVLNDYFMRYMFAKEGHEHILKNLINSVRIDANQEPFEYIEVLNSFNLKENVFDKESIADVKAKTKSGETIIIEIQRIGNHSIYLLIKN
ncbi:hypothetical protein BFL38_01115 [Brachyspira hampsonii]|uniref:Transposase n=1 Tax=Brachyspira hampsonii TaxID=1287055 RepID=A0A1E5NAJ8_9SPIR|nr:hypothetical protein BFL38_01115 [Brachyspira hampsonii]